MSNASDDRDRVRRAYTCTVVAWLPAGIAALVAIGVAAGVLLVTGVSAIAAAVAVAVVALCAVSVGLHLGSVRLAVSAIGVSVGSGLTGRSRWIPGDQITHVQVARLTWPQVYGFGLPLTWRLTRMSVRAGPALRLWLHSGEQLWVSAADARRAAELLTDIPGRPASTRPTGRSQTT